MKWTNTIEAVADVEQSKAKGQWRIGDAAIKDLKDQGYLGNASELGGPTQIETSVFVDCTEKLAEKGIRA